MVSEGVFPRFGHTCPYLVLPEDYESPEGCALGRQGEPLARSLRSEETAFRWSGPTVIRDTAIRIVLGWRRPGEKARRMV